MHHVIPPFPRAIKEKFHILFAHLRQLHLTAHLLRPDAPQYDVYFVDQLSTCVPFLRALGNTRVVFYCHFPDKLLANGEFVGGKLQKKNMGLLKTVYRIPMDWWEELTTSKVKHPLPTLLVAQMLAQDKRMSSFQIPTLLQECSSHISPVYEPPHKLFTLV